MVWCARAFAIFICCLVMAAGARAEDPCAEGQLVSAEVNDGSLILHWTGTVRYEMDKRIAEKFDQVKDRVKAVVLDLSSCGGDSPTMQRTIDVLKHIKETHRVFTTVWRGKICASACIPIFLQGTTRTAALSSIWMFHEPSYRDPDLIDGDVNARITDPAETQERLKLFEAAGVSKRWLKRLRARIKGAEWWQTGSDLWEARSGIITEVVGNSVSRDTKEQKLAVIGRTRCALCSDPRLYVGQKPRPQYLPDPMDMLGMPPRRRR